jgi:hypothetical protein
VEKKNFYYDEKLRQHFFETSEIMIEVDDEQMSAKTIKLAETVLAAYAARAPVIARYLARDEGIISCYGKMTPAQLAAKMGKPIIKIDENGGILSYCQHKLDGDHIIDLEFAGALEKFLYVSIDG